MGDRLRLQNLMGDVLVQTTTKSSSQQEEQEVEDSYRLRRLNDVNLEQAMLSGRKRTSLEVARAESLFLMVGSQGGE